MYTKVFVSQAIELRIVFIVFSLLVERIINSGNVS